jgi:hypothetical protein
LIATREKRKPAQADKVRAASDSGEAACYLTAAIADLQWPQ